MAVPRFFLAERITDTGRTVAVPLSPADLHHAVSVLRLRSGDEIEVVEPGGHQVLRVILASADTSALLGEIIERAEGQRGPAVTLIQGVAKGDKMDDIIRHAVELGAERVLPVITERTVVRLTSVKAAEKGERWRRIARSAAEQAHRTEVPEVADPAPLPTAVSRLSEFDRVVVLWEETGGVSLEEALGAYEPGTRPRVALVVGPEGGLSAQEVAALKDAGAVVASLGAVILRTETAALAALTLATHHLGGLGRA